MTNRDQLGGVIHTYQKFDPVEFPSPTAPPPDMISPAFEHLLYYGNMRRLTISQHPMPASVAGSRIHTPAVLTDATCASNAGYQSNGAYVVPKYR